MYKTNNVKFPYVKNNKQPLKIEKETVGEDLVGILKGARFYNHEIIKNNRRLLVHEEFLQIDCLTYQQYGQQMLAHNENQELSRENGFYEYMLESLKYIEKLPLDEYLLVVNYLYGEDAEINEIMNITGITTKQGLARKAKTLIKKAHKSHFRETLNNL